MSTQKQFKSNSQMARHYFGEAVALKCDYDSQGIKSGSNDDGGVKPPIANIKEA